MRPIYEIIKEMRLQLHLSQEYVANYLGVNRSTFSQMENGNRKILADEVPKLCVLFGVSADTLFGRTTTSQSTSVFARSFANLSEVDQAEIMNLIRFKEQMKATREGKKPFENVLTHIGGKLSVYVVCWWMQQWLDLWQAVWKFIEC